MRKLRNNYFLVSVIKQKMPQLPVTMKASKVIVDAVVSNRR